MHEMCRVRDKQAKVTRSKWREPTEGSNARFSKLVHQEPCALYPTVNFP